MKKQWKIVFFERENGQVPVREFLDSLPEKHKAKALWEIELLEEYGTYLKEPYAKSIKGKKYEGLWELRIKFAGDISRIFYFMPLGDVFVLLHGFVKKSQKTPREEMERARGYMLECIRKVRNYG